MAVSKIPNPNSMVGGTATSTIGQAHGSRSTITAPSMPGYRFHHWICAVSSGWVGNVYIESPFSATSNIWSANYGYTVTGQGNVTAYCIYVPA